MQNQIIDQRMQENLEAIEKLRLLDDDLMTLVFDKNIEVTELLLSILLQRNDLKVLEVVAQREYKNSMAGGRSIKIDIYAMDADGKIYDVEVQRADRGADAHRARFHSSMILEPQVPRICFIRCWQSRLSILKRQKEGRKACARCSKSWRRSECWKIIRLLPKKC